MIAHALLEWSAYLIGFRLYWRYRDVASLPIETWQRVAIAAGAIAGAAIGSKVLYVIDYWSFLADAPG